MEKLERLQKYLARCGVASRRKSEEIILEGRVTVNNQVVTELGTKINPRKDKIKVDGKRVFPEDRITLILHKPAGVVTTLDDPEQRKTVLDLLPEMGARVYPVGRLDYHSEGLILMTNDGSLANQIMHPRTKFPKEYDVKIKGHVKEQHLQNMRDGIILDGKKTLPAKVEIKEVLEKNTWLHFTVTEGRNRLIRDMCASQGYEVIRLIRVAIGPILLDNLEPGKFRYLSSQEIMKLLKISGKRVSKKKK